MPSSWPPGVQVDFARVFGSERCYLDFVADLERDLVIGDVDDRMLDVQGLRSQSIVPLD